MDEAGDFVAEGEFNRKLTSPILSLNDLGIYIRFRFKTTQEAGRLAGISENRVRQLLIGYCLPKTSKLINKIAKGWEIDPVTLTLLFDREREE